MNTYYIVQDDEGIWLTKTPSPTDIIIHQTTDHSEARRRRNYYVVSRARSVPRPPTKPMNTIESDLRNLSTHIVLNADYVEEQSTDKYTVLHVEPQLYDKFIRLLESLCH